MLSTTLNPDSSSPPPTTSTYHYHYTTRNQIILLPLQHTKASHNASSSSNLSSPCSPKLSSHSKFVRMSESRTEQQTRNAWPARPLDLSGLEESQQNNRPPLSAIAKIARSRRRYSLAPSTWRVSHSQLSASTCGTRLPKCLPARDTLDHSFHDPSHRCLTARPGLPLPSSAEQGAMLVHRHRLVCLLLRPTVNGQKRATSRARRHRPAAAPALVSPSDLPTSSVPPCLTQ
ncbi:hypothetical protein B0T11DRAFT_117527 [Plectosphaerella cucumerina]|uniref:Uncharacterized protein n=1 Tax=Plectosphaerella cucumerina TaxID=40658 RepID=A0A8K0T9I0_9PEZI|nr:hypothetical protein B0T11DRAFT_117527 [Plectosphaerella cucumerina]